MTVESRLASLAAPSSGTPQLLATANPRVVVVGDVILDGWWHGVVRRVCREAPAPVVELQGRNEAPGGAANTAVNAARLGGSVSLVSVVGADAAGRRLRALLEDGGVDCAALVASPDVTTTTKSRIVGGDQIVARLDEQGEPPASAALSTLAARLADALAGADAVVICDYGLGTLEGEVGVELERLLAPTDRRPPSRHNEGSARPDSSAAPRPGRPLVVVDAHDLSRWARVHPDLATPNAEEAFRALGGLRSADRPALMRAQRSRLLEVTGARCVVVTMDRDGTLALPGPDFALGTEVPPGAASDEHPIPEHRTWARPNRETQASGAGDTFVACLTVGLAAGLPAPTALDLAQAAADVVVRRPETSVCGTDDLEEYLGGLAAAVTGADDLARRVEQHRREGRRIVLTNGCFDVLHRGHTRYLEQARQLGDVLVVAINDDEYVRRVKGPDRPINPAPDRAAVLAALSCVDHVTVFASGTAVPLVERLRPDVYAKGGDYSPDMLAETSAVEAYGGTVAILDYVPDRSTSEVLRRIRSSADAVAEGQPVVEQEPA